MFAFGACRALSGRILCRSARHFSRKDTTRNTSAAPEAQFLGPGTDAHAAGLARSSASVSAAPLPSEPLCAVTAAQLREPFPTPGDAGQQERPVAQQCVPAALRTREEIGTQTELSPPPHHPAPAPQHGRAPPRRSFRPPPGTERPPDGAAPQGEARGGARGTACGAFAALRGDPRGSGPALGAYRAAASSSFPRLRGAARREVTGPGRAGPGRARRRREAEGARRGARGRQGAPPPPRPVPPLAGGAAAQRTRQPSPSRANRGPSGRVRCGDARAPIGGPGRARAVRRCAAPEGAAVTAAAPERRGGLPPAAPAQLDYLCGETFLTYLWDQVAMKVSFPILSSPCWRGFPRKARKCCLENGGAAQPGLCEGESGWEHRPGREGRAEPTASRQGEQRPGEEAALGMPVPLGVVEYSSAFCGPESHFTEGLLCDTHPPLVRSVSNTHRVPFLSPAQGEGTTFSS